MLLFKQTVGLARNLIKTQHSNFLNSVTVVSRGHGTLARTLLRVSGAGDRLPETELSCVRILYQHCTVYTVVAQYTITVAVWASSADRSRRKVISSDDSNSVSLCSSRPTSETRDSERPLSISTCVTQQKYQELYDH